MIQFKSVSLELFAFSMKKVVVKRNFLNVISLELHYVFDLNLSSQKNTKVFSRSLSYILLAEVKVKLLNKDDI